MGSSSPPAPDYVGAAQATAQGNQAALAQQTSANRPDIYTPFGSQTWQNYTDPTTGEQKWRQSNVLDPETQRALSSQQELQANRSEMGNALLGRVGQDLANPVDWNSFQQQANPLDNSQSAQSYYDKAGDAVYNKFSARAEPQFAKDTAALETQLRNQGVNPGDEAYDSQLKQLRQSQDDARSQANFGAISASGAEAARMQGMNLGQQQQSFNQTNQTRSDQIAQEMQKRGFDLNEINALISGQQVDASGAAGNAGAKAGLGQGVDYNAVTQGNYNSALDASNASNANTNAYLSTGATLAVAAFA
jgi:hypothetical protein